MAYDAPQSRNEAILQNILGANNVLVDPQSRIEAILQAILYDETYDEEAMSRMEELLLAIKNSGVWNHTPISRNEEILYAKLTGGDYNKEPQSRIEELLIDWLNHEPSFVIDTAPYLFRQSGGDNNAYVGTEETDKLVGASAVVNQLVDTGATEVPTISGHKYLTRINSVVTIQQGTGTEISINDADEDNAHDLTAMFGTAIADYVYSLEQATEGSGIAYLRKYGFFTKDYYPYTANTLQSVNTSAHITMSANRWDEEWEIGIYSWNGAKAYSSSRIRCKNFISCIPQATYYVKAPNNIQFFFYDKNKTFVQYMAYSISNRTFTIPDGCYYMTFYVYSDNYGTTYNNDISINYPATDTTYHAYSKHEYALPSTDLRGLYKLDASNNLYADGDTLEGDDTKTNNYIYVDLGSLTWNKTSSTQFNLFRASVEDIKTNDSYSSVPDMICPRYVTVCPNDRANKTIYTQVNQGQTIDIIDNDYTDAQTFKASLNGVYLVAKRNTPTTETATGFTNPQIVDKYGTEEYTDERDFPLPVGHETKYPSR